MHTQPHFADLGRTANRLVEILAFATRPDLEEDPGHQGVALHLLSLELEILNRRWQNLVPILERLRGDAERRRKETPPLD